MKKLLIAAIALCVGTACTQTSKPEPQAATKPQVNSFHLSTVRLLDSPFKHAEQRGRDYIMSLDADKLMSPYLREAGLPTKAPTYGNWEGDGLDGHIGGHYLTALSLLYASTGDEEALRRLNYALDQLDAAQKANGNGYIGGVPGGEATWEQVAAGNIDADLFSLNGKWVPWYNLHKVYAGLLDAYRYAGQDRALDMLLKLTDWTQALVADLSDDEIQTMLRTEHGGMNEVFADLAAITGNPEHLKLARQFSQHLILDPLLEERDQLTGLHANTQIPKVVGYKRVADVAGDEDWDRASAFFFDTVINHRTVAIGGNSVREHFHPKDDFTAMITDPEGPETCNTYNMLKLARYLFESTGDYRYMTYYERALYNHILSSQHPEHGGLVYFTSMRPSHYRTYSHSQKAMWCCVGSGIENHVKYGELIYGYSDDAVYVNLFIPSRLNAQAQGVALTMDTVFPDDESVRIRFDADSERALKVRYPAWVEAGQLQVTINGDAQAVDTPPGEYVTLERQWQQGDTVELLAPMHLHKEQMPDQSDYYAVLYGPLVLAAKTQPFPGERLNLVADDSRMGHIASGEMCPTEQWPAFVAENPDFLDQMEPVPGQSLTFRAPGLIDNVGRDNLELIPFFRLHDSRYVVYWPFSTPNRLAELREARARDEAQRRALDARTVDQVAPGEQQPEADHYFRGERTEAGVHQGRHWRHAEGWFSYELNDPEREARVLRITYYGLDAGREFEILINGELLAEVALEEGYGDSFYTVDYPIPSEWVETAPEGRLTVRFQAKPGSIAGGFYGVRLLRAE
ncbi:glycoside hydrolase family 127 protein [Marinimicrobium alkaliphilum]|uniref:glycoside hydrolase family 127 protein n=1 Tax=Marinimicrobium alkaliphilum TaxID=2202654 RepID=UPI000DBA1B02|nr:glycoside hydrolase family 127 protein [Marinimicrobium alkaliphilum]